jgi:hypothetical protein
MTAAAVATLARLRAEELERISEMPEGPPPKLRVPPSHPQASYRGVSSTHGFNSVFVDENHCLREHNKLLTEKVRELEHKIEKMRLREIKKLEYELEEARKVS